MTIWGPHISTLQVEQAIRVMLQTWLDSALTELERHSGEWAIREIPRPNSWEVVSDLDDIEDWPDRNLPAVIVEAAGKDPTFREQGAVDAQIAFVITTLHRGSGKLSNRESDRRIVLTIADAVEWLLLKQPDFTIGRIVPGVTQPDIAKPTRPRTISGAETELLVIVGDVANRYGIPDEPDPAPPTDPPVDSPEYPDHTTTHVNVTVIEED